MSKQSVEEKVATTILSSLDSVSLDLDQVGKYIGRRDNLSFNRLMIVVEASEEEKVIHEERNKSMFF